MEQQDWKLGDEISVEFIGKITCIERGVTGVILYTIKNEFDRLELPEMARVRSSRIYPLPEPKDFKVSKCTSGNMVEK